MSNVKTRKARRDIEFATAVTTTGSVAKAAEVVGVSRATGHRMMAKEEVQQLVEEQSQRLLQLVPKAVDNMATLVANMDTTVAVPIYKDGVKVGEQKELKYDPKITYDATKEVLKSPGLLSGGQVSVQVGKLTVNNNTQIISPAVLQLIQSSICKTVESVTDVTEEATIVTVTDDADNDTTVDNSETSVV